MRFLVPFLLTTALVAALPTPQDVDVVYVTVYEDAPPADATPAPAAAAAPAPADPAPTDTPQPAAQPVAAGLIGAQSSTTVKAAGLTYTDGVTNRMSTAQVDAIYKTCWNGALQWPIPNTPAPGQDVVASQLDIFSRPATAPNTLTINNHCSYDIHFSHLNGAAMVEQGVIPAKSNTAKPFAGTVWKGSKSPDMSNEVLIEYSVGGDGNVYYDLSLITCINNGDTSNCAGHEAGLQLGGPNQKTFQCANSAWCDDQAYMYQENLCKKQNPVSATPAGNGLTMEFCASQK